jgi:hypothetical protein
LGRDGKGPLADARPDAHDTGGPALAHAILHKCSANT